MQQFKEFSTSKLLKKKGSDLKIECNLLLFFRSDFFLAKTYILQKKILKFVKGYFSQKIFKLKNKLKLIFIFL
jgi:hypothetical protein